MWRSRRAMRKRSRPPGPRDEEAAREKCLRLLATRARAAAELRQRLRLAGFEQNIIETVLADLERADLVNDEEFARQWVAQRVASGAGRNRLGWELRRKGVREDLIRRAVDEAIDDGTEFEQALGLAQRRLRGQPAEGADLLRLRRFLVGRGYGFGTVERVMRHLAAQEDLSDVS